MLVVISMRTLNRYSGFVVQWEIELFIYIERPLIKIRLNSVFQGILTILLFFIGRNKKKRCVPLKETFPCFIRLS